MAKRGPSCHITTTTTTIVPREGARAAAEVARAAAGAARAAAGPAAVFIYWAVCSCFFFFSFVLFVTDLSFFNYFRLYLYSSEGKKGGVNEEAQVCCYIPFFALLSSLTIIYS
jgi:hypothetical protein